MATGASAKKPTISTKAMSWWRGTPPLRGAA
jgi:hypothetical protein